MAALWPLVLLVVQGWGLFFPLAPGKVRCIGISLEPKVSFSGTYVFTGQGEQNVIARVTTPKGTLLHQNPNTAKEGKFLLTSEEAGIYKLCFQGLDNSEKTVSFHFATTDKMKEDELATDSELQPLRNGLVSMGRVLDSIYRNIHFYQLRERTHRDLTERTCDRILWSALVKMLVLALISCVQIYILKALFRSKSGQSV